MGPYYHAMGKKIWKSGKSGCGDQGGLGLHFERSIPALLLGSRAAGLGRLSWLAGLTGLAPGVGPEVRYLWQHVAACGIRLDELALLDSSFASWLAGLAWLAG